ncbi:Bile acid-CoA hydrolase [compost metagenome]
MIIAGNGDAIFRRFMAAIGRDDLGQDPRLAHNDGRVQHNAMLDDAIAAWTSAHGLDTVLATLEAAAVPCGRIYTAGDICDDPHYSARDMIESHQLPDGSPLALSGIVPRLSATPGRTNWIGPALGEHTEEILAGIGIDGAEFRALRAAGVV